MPLIMDAENGITKWRRGSLMRDSQAAKWKAARENSLLLRIMSSI